MRERAAVAARAASGESKRQAHSERREAGERKAKAGSGSGLWSSRCCNREREREPLLQRLLLSVERASERSRQKGERGMHDDDDARDQIRKDGAAGALAHTHACSGKTGVGAAAAAACPRLRKARCAASLSLSLTTASLARCSESARTASERPLGLTQRTSCVSSSSSE